MKILSMFFIAGVLISSESSCSSAASFAIFTTPADPNLNVHNAFSAFCNISNFPDTSSTRSDSISSNSTLTNSVEQSPIEQSPSVASTSIKSRSMKSRSAKAHSVKTETVSITNEDFEKAMNNFKLLSPMIITEPHSGPATTEALRLLKATKDAIELEETVLIAIVESMIVQIKAENWKKHPCNIS